MKYSRFIVVLFFCFNQIYSSVINIPEDIETIQGGIDLAENGDTVLVAPGTYVEHIIISEKSISLLSTQGSEFTVIDGDYSGRVVTIENCGDSLLVLSGFTITKGNVLGFGEHGGGLFCLESNLLFEDLIITDNHASETFVIVAGVLIESSNLTLRNVTIENNHNPFGSIGGMHSFESNLLIENVTIRNNSSGNDAGGLFLDGVNQLTNVMIYNNHANYGPVVFFSGENKLNNVLIQGNVSNNGMGIYGGVSVHGNTVFNNVTMSNNISDDGNISILNGNLVLINSVIWGNEPEEIIFAGQSNPIIFTAAYSDIQGGLESIEPNDVGEINWLEGNIDLDPQFTDTTNGDFTLLPTSPCIDVGTPFFVWEGDTLVNMSENEYFGSAPDMGAFEYGMSGGTDITVFYNTDWNIVGLPLEVANGNYQNLFLNVYSGTLYSHDINYQPEQTLETGGGYLLRFIDDESVTFSGIPLNEITLSLSAGWNLFSGLSTALIPEYIYSFSIIQDGTLNGLDGDYFSPESIEPGKGYWVRATEDGEITLTSGGSARQVPFVNRMNDANLISFSNENYSTNLYFGVDVPENEKLSYSLPPKFPQMAFDIRFNGDMKYTMESGDIEVLNTSDNLTISYDIIIDAGEHLNWMLTSESGEEYILEGTGEITIPTEETFTLERKAIIPITYTLHQNYPNPFNPITSLRYDLPEQAQVTLTIYDLIGREVTQLVNTTQEAGYRSVQWNATNMHGKPVSAGVYLYQIRAGEFVQTRKMVLLK